MLVLTPRGGNDDGRSHGERKSDRRDDAAHPWRSRRSADRSTRRATAGRRRPGRRWRRRVSRSPGCRKISAAPARIWPTASPCCARRDASLLAVPLAETLLAGWLLSRGGIAAPKGAMTCGPAREGDRLTLAGNGTLERRAALRSVRQGRQASGRARAPRQWRRCRCSRRCVAAAHCRRHEHRRRSSQCA